MKKKIDKTEAASFPQEGNCRAKEAITYLGIGRSTFWKWVAEGRISKRRFSARITVFDAKEIRDIAANGLPEAGEAA